MAQQIKKKFLSPELISQVDSLEQSVTALQSSKADKSYVDQKDQDLAQDISSLEGVVQGNFDLQQSDIDGLRSDVDANSSAISSEVSARQAADQNLQSQIDNLLSNTSPEALDSLSEVVAAFEAADSNLNNAISSLASSASSALQSEQQARVSADQALQGEIDAEEIARAAADQTLQNNIEAEAQSREAGDSSTLLQAKAYTDEKISQIPAVDLSGYYTKSEVDAKDAVLASDISDLEVYAQEIRVDHDDLDAYAQDIRSDVDGHESRIALLEAQTDGPSFADEHKLMSEQPSLAYLDLNVQVKKIMSCAVGRAMIHESIDFTVSTVGGKTRITFIGSLVNPTGEEAIEGTDMVHVVYAY